MTRAERHAEVKALREGEGLTFREIGERLGIGISAANDYYLDPTGEKVQERKRKRCGSCLDCGRPTYNSGSVSVPERCLSCARTWAGTLTARRLLSASRKGRRLRWTDDDIRAVLRRLADDGDLTTTRYKQAYAEAPRGAMPSPPTVVLRFGGWNAALAAAGLPVKHPRPAYRGTLTKAGSLLALEDCAADVGRPPVYAEYEEWARRVGAPSGARIRVLWGNSWMSAVDALDEQAA